jgi:hypothetical protein
MLGFDSETEWYCKQVIVESDYVKKVQNNKRRRHNVYPYFSHRGKKLLCKEC